jgi:hypothetical protein
LFQKTELIHHAIVNSAASSALPVRPPAPGGAVLSTGKQEMAQPAHIDIVRRAYELWEQAGKPEGKDQEFYHQAEQELRNEDKSSPLRTPDNL